jgi:hypothetical protein
VGDKGVFYSSVDELTDHLETIQKNTAQSMRKGNGMITQYGTNKLLEDYKMMGQITALSISNWKTGQNLMAANFV